MFRPAPSILLHVSCVLNVESIHAPELPDYDHSALITHKQRRRAAWSQSRPTIETNLSNSPDFTLYVSRTGDDEYPRHHLGRCAAENTVSSRQWATRLHTHLHLFATNQLDRLPPEFITEVLLRLDIPSLTRFRGLNRCTMEAMELLNSVYQYTAIIEHCRNIIRAFVSIEADAFDCGKLYRTLCTS